ncbi:MAG: zinc transporter ZntB [Gammaproteobacteria bacterium]|nr:zinc transporter ZntB [Gammaproteobacteria bacterium]
MAVNPPEFLHACILDGRGGADFIDAAAVNDWTQDQGVLWVHINLDDEGSRQWLASSSGLDDSIVGALLAGETRPRSHTTRDGLLVVLRGVNTNPGEDPEDMVSVRLWIGPDRIISTRRRRLFSVADMREALENGVGPSTTGAFLAALIGRLANRIGDFVNDIEEDVGSAEDQLGMQDKVIFRHVISALRRKTATVRRFLAPQRDALDRLYRAPGAWFSDTDIQLLREEADRITRYLEDLDLAREQTMVLREEFHAWLAEEQNSRMYVLSVVAAIFLPLTFVTGLLGMNVGGLPGLESPRGFLGSIAVMLVSAAALLSFFRWKKWL